MAKPWDIFITDRDRAVYSQAGYGRARFDSGRTAVLVIDMTVAFLGDRPEPLLESAKRFPNSCGEEGWEVAERLALFLDTARTANVPIVYIVKDLEHSAVAAAAWGATQRAAHNSDAAFTSIIGPLAPRDGDVMIRKTKPSAFFATPLLQQLFAWRTERLVCCGATTSGCVRATVTDAFSHGFRVVVAEDGVCDRGQASHALSLFDMAQKYADVRTLAEIEEGLR